MSEVAKTVGQLLVNNMSLTLIVILWIIGGLFKITKKEINPLGWIFSKIGEVVTKDVRKDLAATNTTIVDLRTDLDTFEKRTEDSISEIKKGTAKNCDALKKRLDKMEASNDKQTIRQIRAHVLEFANSCMSGHNHTKLDFDNIIHENSIYEELCKRYRIKNQVYKEDYDFIMKIYHKKQEENSFLKESDADALCG